MPHSSSCTISDAPVGVYAKRQCEDARSPCPALNSLANCGFISRDGKRISSSELIEALVRHYGVKRPFATVLVILTMFGIGEKRWRGWRLELSMSLDQVRRVAHPAALFHNDPKPSSEGPLNSIAPSSPNHYLIDEFLEDSDPKSSTVDLTDFARWRNTREARPVGFFASRIAQGELALLLQVFGHGDKHTVHKDVLRQFVAEERLPEDWKPLPNNVSGLSTFRVGRQVHREMMFLSLGNMAVKKGWRISVTPAVFVLLFISLFAGLVVALPVFR